MVQINRYCNKFIWSLWSAINSIVKRWRRRFWKLKQEAEKLGLVIGGDTTKSAEQFNDSLTQLGSIFTGLANEIATAVLPMLNNITQAMFNSYIESDQLRVGIQEIIRTDLPRWLDNVAYGFAFTADAIGNVINIVRGFIQVLQHAGDVISYVMANVEYSMAITDQAQESALAKQSSVLAKLKQTKRLWPVSKEKIANAWRYSDELKAITKPNRRRHRRWPFSYS